MNITTRTIQFKDSDLRGPAHEQAAIAAAFVRHHLPEVSVATSTHVPAITMRATSRDVVALASAAVIALDKPRAPRMRADSFTK